MHTRRLYHHALLLSLALAVAACHSDEFELDFLGEGADAHAYVARFINNWLIDIGDGNATVEKESAWSAKSDRMSAVQLLAHALELTERPYTYAYTDQNGGRIDLPRAESDYPNPVVWGSALGYWRTEDGSVVYVILDQEGDVVNDKQYSMIYKLRLRLR